MHNKEINEKDLAEGFTEYGKLAQKIMYEESAKLIEESRDLLIERTRQRLSQMAAEAQAHYEDKTL